MAGTRRAPSGHQRGRARPVKRRGLKWSLGVLLCVILATGSLLALAYHRLDSNIQGADVDDLIGGDRPDKSSTGALNLLVIGSDSRDGMGDQYGSGFETMNSDTMMIVHVAADRKWATVVSVPRDSWVEIPACDKGDGSQSEPHDAKINEAFAIGGLSGEISGAAACAIKTIERASGLRIDHFVSLDFLGFKGMVDALGGVEVCPDEPINDKKAKLTLDSGCQAIKGEQALGYVRARYSIGDGSDIGRMERQQEFMASLAKKAQSKLSSPQALYDFLDAVTQSLTTDKDLAGLKPLNDLANEVKEIPSDRLTFLTVPNYPRERDVPTDKANVVWQYPQAERLFTALAKDQEVNKEELEKSAEATDAITPAQIRVRVLNGTETTGKAAEVAEQLRTAGFQVLGTGNADQPATATTITYPNGLRPKAEVLSGRIPGATTTQGEDGSAALTLTIGPDFRGVRG